MTLIQKRLHKRRMADERIADYMTGIDFEESPNVWLSQFERVFRSIIRYEYYLNKVPENIAHPRYHTIVLKTVYRMLCQAPEDKISFSRNLNIPDPKIKAILDHFRVVEIKRKESLFRRFPNRTREIAADLRRLRDDFEI